MGNRTEMAKKMRISANSKQFAQFHTNNILGKQNTKKKKKKIYGHFKGQMIDLLDITSKTLQWIPLIQGSPSDCKGYINVLTLTLTLNNWIYM